MGVVPVVVHTLAQVSGSAVRLAYAAPVGVALATPQGRPIEGGFPVVVRGKVGVGVRVCM